MTLLELPSPAVFPADPIYGEGGLQATVNLNATNVKVAFTFMNLKAANALSIFFRTSTVTTSQSIKVGLQALTSTGGLGKPSGTWLGATNNGYGTQASLASNTTYEVTLGEQVALAANTPYAVVIEWTSTTGVIALVQRYTASMMIASPTWMHHFMGGMVYTSSWGASSTSLQYVFGVRTDHANGWFDPNRILPSNSQTWSTTLNTGSTPDEFGNRLYLPAGRCDGVIFHSDLDGPVDVVLYDDSDNVVASASVDHTLRSVDTYYSYMIPFTTPYENAAGWYRAVLKPTSTTNIRRLSAGYTANQIAGLSMGSNAYLTQRTDAGAWTDTTTSLAQVAVYMGALQSGGSSSVIIIGGEG